MVSLHMRESDNLKNGSTPKAVTFKRHAHLFTLISVVWTAFTLLAAFLFKQDRDPDNLLIAVGIWVLHATFIGLSIYFWITERESVLMVQTDKDGGN